MQTLTKYLFIVICCIVHCISISFADTSELGLGVQIGMNQALIDQTLSSPLESYKGTQHTWSNREYLVRFGVGLNFSSTLWLDAGIRHNDILVQPTQTSIVCLDQSQEARIRLGLSPQVNDQCLRISGEVDLITYVGELGYVYKPYDDFSPIFEAGIGGAYRPHSRLWTRLEKIKENDSKTEWVSLPISTQVNLIEQFYLVSHLALGFEKRLWSVWGIRLLTSLKAEIPLGIYPTQPEINYGLSLGLVHYHYLRLF